LSGSSRRWRLARGYVDSSTGAVEVAVVSGAAEVVATIDCSEVGTGDVAVSALMVAARTAAVDSAGGHMAVAPSTDAVTVAVRPDAAAATPIANPARASSTATTAAHRPNDLGTDPARQ
jgi:hypothetical protein